MKKFKSNKYQVIAGFSAVIFLGVGHFIKLPDIVAGFCVGLCIVFYLIGGYALNHDVSKLQAFKKSLLQKHFTHQE